MRGATDGRFPDTQRTLRTHVSHPRQGHGAGTCDTKGPPCFGTAVQAARRFVARKTGPCLAKARGGRVRAWLFLASAFRVQGRQHAEEQYRVLEDEIRQKCPAGRRGATSTKTPRLASVRRLGVPTQLNGEVGEGRPAPRGTHTKITSGGVMGPIARTQDGLMLRLRAVRERGRLSHSMSVAAAASGRTAVIGGGGRKCQSGAASMSRLSGSQTENISETRCRISATSHRLARIQHALRGELPRWQGLAFV